MKTIIFRAIPLMLILILAGCASTERFVLLPSPTGQQTAIVVKADGKEQIVDQPYTGVSRSSGGLEAVRTDENEVNQHFGSALSALPPKPVQYLVYFLNNSNALTAESVPIFDHIKADLVSRPAAEIVVIGHTDLVGSQLQNDALSLDRASVVRDALVAAGLPADRISIAGRGMREPIVATAAGVPEARNRRVEIRVR